MPKLGDISSINQAAIDYWLKSFGQNKTFGSREHLTDSNHQRYSRRIDELCGELDKKIMFARVTFFGNEQLEVVISSKTWERQEGHYPTVARFFSDVARHPFLANKKATIIVWLEDGLWQWQQEYSMRAPTLAFGRQIYDKCTLLIPDPAFLEDYGYKRDLIELDSMSSKSPWELRIPTIFWRGAATGLGIEGTNWSKTARGRLTLMAKEINDPSVLDAEITKVSHLPPLQQEILNTETLVGPPVPFNNFLKYRYLVDADGYCCAWKSLFLKLASGSLTLKIQSDYEQWYFHKLAPWVNYIPIKPDLADLRLVANWLKDNDTTAAGIAEEGRRLAGAVTYEDALDEVAQICAVLGESVRS